MKDRVFLFFLLLLSVKGYSQCTLSVSLSSSNPVICSESSVILTATASGGTAPYSYVWNTGETTPAIAVNKGGTYSVTVSDKTPGCSPVTQSVTISSASNPSPPTAASVIVCQNSQATLTATAPGGTYQWYDAATGGNFLASGDTYITAPIKYGTLFYVQTTINNCTSTRRPVYVGVFANPTVKGTSVCAGNVATLLASGGDTYQWYDARSGGNLVSTSQNFTTPPLFNTTTYYVIASSNGCSSSPTPVTATVVQTPQPPTASNVTVCSGNVANLHANSAGNIIEWFDVPSGGTPLIASPDYTTPPLTNTTTYYVEAIAGSDCESTRTPVTVTVSPIPSAPVAQGASTCPGTSATLNVTGAGTYQWFSSAFSPTVLFTGNTFHTPVLNAPTTYYVALVSGGCPSSRTPVNVTLITAPSAPTAAGQIICSGSAANLNATAAPGSAFQWYDAAVRGNLLATTASYTTPALTSNTTYYVEDIDSACVSSRTPVKVTVLAAPAAPTSRDTAICSGTSATLNASGPSGQYDWFDSATGGNLLISGQVYATPLLTATTTFYVQVTVGGCASPRTPVKITVNALSPSPTASGTIICPGSQASLTASSPGGAVQWFDADTAGNLLFTGNTYTTPFLFKTTTYYAQNSSGICSSKRTPVTVTVTSLPNPQFKYPSGTICTSGANVAPVINNPSGGTFTSSPAGLIFLAPTTGAINVSGSALGAYTIFFHSKGTCPTTTSAKISIVSTPDAHFSYSGPYCQDAANPLPAFPPGASAGVFSASPGGLVFINTSTGEIDLTNSASGTYTVTNTIAASAGCPASVFSVNVTINPRVAVSAGPPQAVLRGTPVQLAGSVSGAPGGTWSGGTGTFNNKSFSNAVYTPGPAENVAQLTFTSIATPCGQKSATVTIIIQNQKPPPPTAPDTAVCAGSNATLFATAPGGNYQWFDAGGKLLSSGPTYITPALVATTVYFVQTQVGGITSNKTKVTVTVNAIPVAPVAQSQTICMHSSAMLVASGSAGTYQWYDAANGGNLLSTTNTYTTPNLIADTAYYVQATNNGCISPRTKVNVLLSPVPVVTSAPTGITCSNSPLNYVMSANTPKATYTWSRAAVAGISNPAVQNQTTDTITETLISTVNTAVNVTYVITPSANGCAGTAFNYVVTVNPQPAITSAATATICNSTTANYSVAFNIPGTTFSWSRAAVPGISNSAVTGQAAATIREVLFNTTNVPVTATYIFNYQTSSCAGNPFNFNVTVNPSVKITSPSFYSICSGSPLNYQIKTTVPNATYTWSRAAVKGIKNPSATGQTTGLINETLIDTETFVVNTIYKIIPTANNCPDSTFLDTVAVYPQPVKPAANGNSPVCTGTTIQLTAPVVIGATYLWTGPSGFTSTVQNPTIQNVTTAYTGTYNLLVSTNGCSSPVSSVSIVVDTLPMAIAGKNQVVCSTVTAVALNGTVKGGTNTGIWSTNGTGTFSPSSNTLNAQYLPSAQDKIVDSVTLTLSSTSNDNCAISTSSISIKFKPVPAVTAGPNQQVCVQATNVPLNGKIIISGGSTWTTAGTGTFSPSASLLNASYMPSAADIQNGTVTLTLHANAPGICYIPTDTLQLKFLPPPILNAGGIRYVLKGHTIVLNPVVSDPNVKYLWLPDVDINNDTLKNPSITGNIDRTYTLSVTDSRGCVRTDQTFIKVSPTLFIPNTFTPNGDGYNDLWDIVGLIAYENATVDIYNRYGTKLFHSIGYPTPWDGTYNGKPVPAGVYYYVINTNYKGQVHSGYVTVIR